MTRWKYDPAYPNPFSPVHKARKFSAVPGTTSEYKENTIRPAYIKTDWNAHISIPNKGKGEEFPSPPQKNQFHKMGKKGTKAHLIVPNPIQPRWKKTTRKGKKNKK